MVAAIKYVEEGKGLREAARLHNVPVESLRRRIIGTVEPICRPGPPTVLTLEEEESLERYIMNMADMGFGLTREDIMRLAFNIVEKCGRQHPFHDGMAGRGWFDGFRARHPRLTLRIPQPLSFCRAFCANEDVIKDFFAKLGAIYAHLNLLSKPMQIFNADETGISVVHKPGKVVAEIGRRTLWSVTAAEKGKNHTILSCVSATGFALPPMMIYPRKKAVPDNLKMGCIPGSLFKNSENGWITQEIYMEWFQWFLANIPPTRPVLLIEDGHASHISIEILELARTNDVHLLCLPAHTTHILQPLDVGVFKSFKTFFSKACHKYLTTYPGRVITTDVIASLVAEAWPQSMTPLNIMSGFRKCGIYPINPGEVSDRQLAPSKAVRPKNPSLSHSSSDFTLSSSADSQPEDKLLPSIFTKEQEALCQTRYEEGYDVYDCSYVTWLQLNHPEAARNFSQAKHPSTAEPNCQENRKANSSGSVITQAPKSIPSNTTVSSCSSSDVLRELLVLPQPKPSKHKKRTALNSKARVITDIEVLEELKRKQVKKAEEEAVKITKRLEREHKKKEKELLKKEKEQKKAERQQKKKAKAKNSTGNEQHMKKKTVRKSAVGRGIKKHTTGKLPGRKQSKNKKMVLENEDDSLLGSDSSYAQCPECHEMYGDDALLWIYCDGCNTWYHVNCTNLTTGRDTYTRRIFLSAMYLVYVTV